MTQTQKRQIALGAAWATARQAGFDLDTTTGDDLLLHLDDLARRQPELIASEWYRNASQNQLRLFTREGNRGRGR